MFISFRMHAPISSNLDFDMDYEQVSPKASTANTPIVMSASSMAKVPDSQPSTEANHMVPNTPSGRTSKVSKNLDFETNYIDSTTAMSATESNVLSQTDKNQPMPADSVHRDTKTPDSIPLGKTHLTSETATKEIDINSADSKPPQSNTIEENASNSTPRPVDIEPKFAPETTEESKPDSNLLQPEKTEETTPDLTPISEPNEASNPRSEPEVIEEKQSKPEDAELPKEETKTDGEPITQPHTETVAEEVENKVTEISSTTQVNLISEKTQTEASAEDVSVSSAANIDTEKSEATEKPNVSAQPSQTIAVTPINAIEELPSSVQPTSNAKEIGKPDSPPPDSTPTVGTIEENKPAATPESEIEVITEAKEKIDETTDTSQSTSAHSDIKVVETTSSTDQSEPPKPQTEDAAVSETTSPKIETVATSTNAITESSIASSTPAINDNERIQDTLPPKESTHTEHTNAEVSSSNPIDNEIIDTSKNEKEASLPQPTPPAATQPPVQPNTKDDANESTNDKIIDGTENASTTMVSSIKLILPLACLILVSYNHQ